MLKHLSSSDEYARKGLVQKGFTLVELLVVIVILGILAAVVVFAVGGATDSAQDNACAAERATVEAAVEAYRARVGAYPTATANLTGGGTGAFLRSTPSWHTVAGSAVTSTGPC